MTVCGYCGIELPAHHQDPGGREREYCTDSHRVMASRLRTAELAYENAEELDDDDPDPDP